MIRMGKKIKPAPLLPLQVPLSLFLNRPTNPLDHTKKTQSLVARIDIKKEKDNDKLRTRKNEFKAKLKK